MNIPKIPKADLDLLAQFDTPTICNVIELFDIRPRTAGYMDGRIQACFPDFPPMVGFATTATFRSAAPPRAGDVYSAIDQQVDILAEAGAPMVVVFQDLDDPAASATFGEVMCSTYQAFGSVGLITSGAGRDLEQVGALKYPAFTNGTICSHGYCHTLSLNIPVHVGGITVEPGDLLHGDANGVTTIPVEAASAIAQACGEFVEAEAAVLDYVKGTDLDPQGYRAAREELMRRISVLKQKLGK